MSAGPVVFFNGQVVTEDRAERLWRQCLKKVVDDMQGAPYQSIFYVNSNLPAEISYRVNQRGALDRFWLRLVSNNTLVITGNRDGLLGMNQGTLRQGWRGVSTS